MEIVARKGDLGTSQSNLNDDENLLTSHIRELLPVIDWKTLYSRALFEEANFALVSNTKPVPCALDEPPASKNAGIQETHKRECPTVEGQHNTESRGGKRHKAIVKEKRQKHRLEDLKCRKDREEFLKTKHQRSSAKVNLDSHDQAKLLHSQQAYIGIRGETYKVEKTLEELLNDGFRLVKNTGKSHSFYDTHGRLVAVYIPPLPSMASVNGQLVAELSCIQAKIDFSATNATQPEDGEEGRRGDFPTISFGISHGGGQKVPGVLCHTPHNQVAIDKLRQSLILQRIATMQSKLYQTWMPHLYEATKQNSEQLIAWKKAPHRIYKNFQGSAFAAMTINFGPRVVCRAHRDHLNWAVGGCAITSGGTFDYVKGGHIVLVELKVVIEFPPGATIIIPSAMVTHANLPIADHEHRVSVTQYSAGGLFRFVEYGYRTAAAFEKQDRKGKQKKDAECEKRWEEYLKFYESEKK